MEVKLRVKEDIKKSGYFWLSSNPSKRVAGTLIIRDGGEIELEIVGLFDQSIEGLKTALNNENLLPRVIGHIEQYGLVTLDECFYINRNICFPGISKSLIYVGKAFLGIAYDDTETVSFNKFEFSVECIDEWVYVTGIKVEGEPENGTATIKYLCPQNISLNLNNGMTLLIKFCWTPPNYPNITEAKITQKTYFELISEEECSPDDFISTAHKITTFLSFAIDQIVCIDKISATSSSKYEKFNDQTHFIPISLIYRSQPFTKSEPKIYWNRMLFTYPEISENAESIINKWLDAYDEIDTALNLYFSTQTKAHKYLESNFLALAQALETYHRKTSNEKLMSEDIFKELTENLMEKCPEEHKQWLSGRLQHGNEIKLRKRIKNIIEPFKEFFGSSKEQKKLITNIIDTRNYFTHYDNSLETKALRGEKLWFLCRKMEAIFQLQLLYILGFKLEEIKFIVNDNGGYQLRKKLGNN